MPPPVIDRPPATAFRFAFPDRVSCSAVGRAGLRVREWPLRYEDEGSERVSMGSVSVGTEAWWSVALSVPDGNGGSLAETVFLRFERHGAQPSDYRGGVVGELTLPRMEVDAIAVLLGGVCWIVIIAGER